MKKVDMRCPECGSFNVLKDAYAEWDVDKQEWALHAVYDDCRCDACGCDITPDEVEVHEDERN